MTPLEPLAGRRPDDLFRLIVEAAPNAMVLLDDQGHVVLVNAQTERLFGYTRQELLAQVLELLVPERCRASGVQERTPFPDAPLIRCLGAGGEWVGRRKDGVEIPLEIGLNPVNTPGGTFVFASITDLTERQRAEDVARRLAAIVESSDDAIVSKDLRGIVRSWNQAAERIFGYSAEEMVGQPITLLLPPERRHEEEEILERLRRGERVDHFETVRVRKDGERIDVSVTISPIRDGFGRVKGASKVARDVTERRRQEAALANHTRLAELAAEVGAALHEDGGLTSNLQRCVEILVQRLDAILARVWILNAPENLLELQASAGTSRHLDGPEGRIPVGEFPIGFVAEQRQPHLADPVLGDPRMRDQEGARCEGVAAFAAYPLLADGQLIGVMALFFPQPLSRFVTDALAATANTIARSVRQHRSELSEILFECVPEAILVVDRAGTISRVNAEAEKVFGYTKQEVVGRPLEMLLPERFRARHVGHREGYFLSPAVRPMGASLTEFRGRRKNGEEFPADVMLSPVGTGSEERVIAAIRDVTPSKQAEEQIRQSERQSRLAAEVGIALVNANELGDLLARCTAALVRHLGVAFARIWTLNEADRVLELQASAGQYTHLDGPHARIPVGKFKIGLIAETRLPLLTNNVLGDERISDRAWAAREGMVAFAGYPLIVAGRLVGVMAMFSRVELAEDCLAMLAAVANQIAVGIERVRNEQSVRERSEELGRANAALAKAARLKDEFLASMSHELRTPLNGVLSLSEALQEEVYGPLNPQQANALRDVEQSGRHLLALINDVLDLSKIEAGEVRLELAPTPVDRVCQAALRLVKELAHKKHLRTTMSSDGQASVILADERRLKQILVNLLGNAVKFTPEGGAIGLEVSANQERGTVAFVVWDTGIGISPENMGLLFRAFQQIDSRLSREYSGTGLGLVLVQRMADLHGGGVTVESTPGQGSRFTVTLPWREVAERADGDPMGGVSAIRTVVLVEDSANDAAHLSRYLSELGIEVVVHASSHGAVERIRKERPDLVLLDVKLPENEGWEILAALKADGELRNIQVVVVSVIDERGRGLGLGAADYLVKPVGRDELRKVLQRLPPQGAV